MKTSGIAICLIPLFAVLLLGTGCATTPPKRAAFEWLGSLPPDAAVYLSFRTDQNKPLVAEITKLAGKAKNAIQSVFDRTQKLYAGIYPFPEDGVAPGKVEFSAYILGNYPKGMIEGSLSESKGWTKGLGGPVSFWKHKETGVELSVPTDYLMCITTNNMNSLLRGLGSGSGRRFPADAEEMFESADASVYLPNPGKDIFPRISGDASRVFPVQDGWIGFKRGKSGYEASAVFVCETAKDARAFGTILKILFLSWSKKPDSPGFTKAVGSLKISAQENKLIITDVPVSENEFIDLFQVFLQQKSEGGL